MFIDDASGRLTQLRFTPTETTLGYLRVLHDHIRAHGAPAALYSDRHSIFSMARTPMQKLKPGLLVPRVSWALNAFRPTLRKPGDVWSAPIRLCRIGW